MCDNPIHDAEREEARDARRFNDYDRMPTCYRHNWVSDGAGGGVCTDCGDTVSAGEL